MQAGIIMARDSQNINMEYLSGEEGKLTRTGKKRTGASKYDMVKVKVRLGEPDGKNPRSHYILSRYLISRMLTLTRIPHAKATKIALELKKQLVDSNQLDIDQATLEHALFGILSARGYGPTHVAVYQLVSRFLAARRPLVVLLVGAPWSGKSTLAQQLAARLNMPNVLSTSVLYKLLKGSGLADLNPTPLTSRHDLNTPAALLPAFCEEAAAVRRALEGDLKKALKDGKPLIIEGSHLDLGALLPQLSSLGLVLVPAAPPEGTPSPSSSPPPRSSAADTSTRISPPDPVPSHTSATLAPAPNQTEDQGRAGGDGHSTEAANQAGVRSQTTLGLCDLGVAAEGHDPVPHPQPHLGLPAPQPQHQHHQYQQQRYHLHHQYQQHLHLHQHPQCPPYTLHHRTQTPYEDGYVGRESHESLAIYPSTSMTSFASHPIHDIYELFEVTGDGDPDMYPCHNDTEAAAHAATTAGDSAADATDATTTPAAAAAAAAAADTVHPDAPRGGTSSRVGTNTEEQSQGQHPPTQRVLVSNQTTPLPSLPSPASQQHLTAPPPQPPPPVQHALAAPPSTHPLSTLSESAPLNPLNSPMSNAPGPPPASLSAMGAATHGAPASSSQPQPGPTLSATRCLATISTPRLSKGPREALISQTQLQARAHSTGPLGVPLHAGRPHSSSSFYAAAGIDRVTAWLPRAGAKTGHLLAFESAAGTSLSSGPVVRGNLQEGLQRQGPCAQPKFGTRLHRTYHSTSSVVGGGEGSMAPGGATLADPESPTATAGAPWAGAAAVSLPPEQGSEHGDHNQSRPGTDLNSAQGGGDGGSVFPDAAHQLPSGRDPDVSGLRSTPLKPLPSRPPEIQRSSDPGGDPGDSNRQSQSPSQHQPQQVAGGPGAAAAAAAAAAGGISLQTWTAAPLFVPVVLQVVSEVDHELIYEECEPEPDHPALPAPHSMHHVRSSSSLHAAGSLGRSLTHGGAAGSGGSAPHPPVLASSLGLPGGLQGQSSVGSGVHSLGFAEAFVSTGGGPGRGQAPGSGFMSPHPSSGQLHLAGLACRGGGGHSGSWAGLASGSGHRQAVPEPFESTDVGVGGPEAEGVSAGGDVRGEEEGLEEGEEEEEEEDIGPVSRARILQSYHTFFRDQGVPVVPVRYGAVTEALDALHDHVLACITSAMLWMDAGSGSDEGSGSGAGSVGA